MTDNKDSGTGSKGSNERKKRPPVPQDLVHHFGQFKSLGRFVPYVDIDGKGRLIDKEGRVVLEVRPLVWLPPTKSDFVIEIAKSMRKKTEDAIRKRNPDFRMPRNGRLSFPVKPFEIHEVTEDKSGRITMETILKPASALWSSRIPGKPAEEVILYTYTRDGSRRFGHCLFYDTVELSEKEWARPEGFDWKKTGTITFYPTQRKLRHWERKMMVDDNNADMWVTELVSVHPRAVRIVVHNAKVPPFTPVKVRLREVKGIIEAEPIQEAKASAVVIDIPEVNLEILDDGAAVKIFGKQLPICDALNQLGKGRMEFTLDMTEKEYKRAKAHLLDEYADKNLKHLPEGSSRLATKLKRKAMCEQCITAYETLRWPEPEEEAQASDEGDAVEEALGAAIDTMPSPDSKELEVTEDGEDDLEEPVSMEAEAEPESSASQPA